MGDMLMLATEWWIEVFRERVTQMVPVAGHTCTAELFCDASGGDKAGMAAVLFVDGKIWYTNQAPCQRVKAMLQKRNDQQIMALELFAIVLGVCTFAHLLQGRRVRIWCDNAGGENALRTGSARSMDHNMIVHGLWLHARRSDYALWVERVASEENIADLPSRGAFEVLESLGAERLPPYIDSAFLRPSDWQGVTMLERGPQLSLSGNVVPC